MVVLSVNSGRVRVNIIVANFDIVVSELDLHSIAVILRLISLRKVWTPLYAPSSYGLNDITIDLVSLFNSISTFMDYLMPKLSLRRTAVILFNPQ